MKGNAPTGYADALRALRRLLAVQEGVVTKRQVVACGLADAFVRTQLRARRWQRLHHGIYLNHAGPRSSAAMWWAALLYAGNGAVLSHVTAAEVWGIAQEPQPELIHVTVPSHRRVKDQSGIRIHYCQRLDAARHPDRVPPVTRIEDTVLDLVDASDALDDVVGWVTRACQRRRTTPTRLVRALELRKKIRWRATLAAMLEDVDSGAESALELAYLRKVERAHGLPRGVRQARWITAGPSGWRDVEYEAYGVIVELDGRVGHVEDGAFRDRRRDNLSTVLGRVTLRYGWTDAVHDSCGTAAEVARVLRARGWPGRVRACGRGCRLTDAA